jgi:S1-C subfamily serine protease
MVMKLLPLLFLVAGIVSGQSAPHQKDIPTIAKDSNGVILSIWTSGKDGHPAAQGTGFVVSKDGRIVTNYHVIRNASSAIVKLPDGAFYDVEGVLEFDKDRDLAVIKARGQDFRTVLLGDSDRVQVGETIVAIGSPLSLESTVSSGIVSGIRTDEKGGKFLQITAPISPGSSGGPLFNMAGEVVGITTLYLEGGENLNFAIPINDAKRLLLVTSKVHQFPGESDQPTRGESAPSQATSEASIANSTGQYGGIVHNKTGSVSAEFGIIVNDVEGVITGCMGVRQPLFGSGPLMGFTKDADIAFVVTSAIGKITFVGKRHETDITGTYTVTGESVSDQEGTFTLHRATSEGLRSNFDTANCPTDAEVHR